MEKRKLVVNAAICDARNVSEETLNSYESIDINAATVLVSKESKLLMSRYNINMNTAEVLEASSDAELMVQNGRYEISDSTLLSKPVVLIVNGTLDITTSSQEVLEMFVSIQVNGAVSYPSDIKGKLPHIGVNGSTDVYPSDAIKLKKKLVVDKTFILRAKDAKYYVKNKVVISDENLDIRSLVEKGTTFITKKAIIAESLLEKSLDLFDESVEIEMIATGLVYIEGGELLNDNLIRKYGDKLYVDGELTINLESENALNKLSKIIVRGNVLIINKLVNTFYDKCLEYNSIKIVKEVILGDKAFVTIDKAIIEKHGGGITVADCGVVNIKDDIRPEEIEDKLQFIDCGVINCSPDQKSSIELVSEDVGFINDNDKLGGLKDMVGGLGLLNKDSDTKVVNAASYTM